MPKRIRVMVVGSGAREDALVRLIGRSETVKEVYVAPGNAGMLLRPKVTRLPDFKPEDIDKLARFAKEQEIALTVVGPEGPLAQGIVDGFEREDLLIFGPNQRAAQIESSKVWAKNLMVRCGVPTAGFYVTHDPENARKYAKVNLPCVIKADGLAGGKGVDVCRTEEEVDAAIERMMVRKELGLAACEVIVEELLTGYELSFMVLTDGTNVLPLLPAMDHKPVFDNDKGPNTGGMGAVAPLPMVTEQLQKRILAEIICPILDGLRSQGIIFRGCLYAGLMITRDGPKVLEFNCRFGDPELQPLALLIESDIVPVFQAIARGSLDGQKLAMSKDAAVCVVMTSGGYPNKYQKKKEIIGLDRALDFPDSDIFFAGVVMEKERLLSDGGRVLSAVAKAKDVPSAIGRVYQLVSQISWEGEHHRGDIGQKVLANGIQLELRRS